MVDSRYDASVNVRLCHAVAASLWGAGAVAVAGTGGGQLHAADILAH